MDQVFFISNFAPDYGGNFLGTLKALEKKIRAKHSVNIVYVLPPAAASKTWCREMLAAGDKIEYVEFTQKGLRKYFKEREFLGNCILHFHFATARNICTVRRVIRDKKNVNLVVHLRMRQNCESGLLKDYIKFYLKAIFGMMVYWGVPLVCVSPGTLSDAKRYYCKSPSYGIFNAIDTSRLSLPEKVNRSRDILMFGTDYERKGVDLAIKAIALSEQKFHLIVVAHSIKDTKAKIEDEFGTVPNFVEVLPPRENIASLYCSAFAFLSPSRSEAFGNAVSEAAYCGCQVIASDIAGQNVQRNIPGIQWIESDNVMQLREAIERAYERVQNSTSELMAENKQQRAIIEECYSLDSWCTAMVTLFESIV